MVHLAGVPPSGSHSGADHVGGDSPNAVVTVALPVADDGHLHLHQLLRERKGLWRWGGGRRGGMGGGARRRSKRKKHREKNPLDLHHAPPQDKSAGSGPTVCSNVAPAGDPGVGAVVEGALGGRQTRRQDEVGEGDGRREPQQADVVVRGGAVIVGMVDDLRHRATHLVGVGALLLLAAQEDRQGAGADPGDTQETQPNSW